MCYPVCIIRIFPVKLHPDSLRCPNGHFIRIFAVRIQCRIRWNNVFNGEIRITATEETFVDPYTGKKVCDVVDHAKTDAGERTIILPESSIKVIRAIRSLNPFGEFMFMDKRGRIRAKRFNRDSREKNKLAISQAINF